MEHLAKKLADYIYEKEIITKEGLSSKMCKLIFRRSYDRHIYYLKLNQRVAPHHFYKPHIKVTYHALSGTGNR